jgi:GNAT superfamily N-acetyltransferase
MPPQTHPQLDGEPLIAPPAIQFVTRLTSVHIEQLWRMYQKEWWSRGRKLHDVRRAVYHSDLVFAFCDSDAGSLVAFARVLTDFVFKALVFDVVVARSHRDLGLGRMLLDAITSHPALLFVEHIELYCRDEMVPFYEKWGFTADLPALRFLRKTQEPLLAGASNTEAKAAGRAKD